MFAVIIKQLLERKLTTVREIEQVTGRGKSTVYRWMNDESEPQLSEMRKLIRHLENPEARHLIVAMLTADLPIVVNWLETHEAVERASEPAHVARGHDAMEYALLALDYVSDVLAKGYEAIRRGELSEDSYTDLVDRMDQSIQHLTVAKNLLKKYAPPSALRATRKE
jgi:transcriptional regulator with XRE-family HTH domain